MACSRNQRSTWCSEGRVDGGTVHLHCSVGSRLVVNDVLEQRDQSLQPRTKGIPRVKEFDADAGLIKGSISIVKQRNYDIN